MKSGSGESTLDDKGRVTIPVRFREQYQGKLVITWGLENCAWIMTSAGFEHFANLLGTSDALTQEERLVLEDKHINLAEEVELDKSGRIAIPPTIRKYAKLTRNCMVVNAENRLSVWDTEVFFAYLSEKEEIARKAFNKLGSKNLFGTPEGK